VDGPFNPNIMPVRATTRYNDLIGKWSVTASRQLSLPSGGVRREVSRQTFDTYDQALTFISVFWGNV
jgi:hypothetical protein